MKANGKKKQLNTRVRLALWKDVSLLCGATGFTKDTIVETAVMTLLGSDDPMVLAQATKIRQAVAAITLASVAVASVANSDPSKVATSALQGVTTERGKSRRN